MKKIKVLHVVESLHTGGMEKIVALIVRSMAKDYDMHVWCLSEEGKLGRALANEGMNIKVLGLTSYFNPFNVFRLAGRLHQEKFDIIHTHGYFASTFVRLAGLLVGMPAMITHTHTIFDNLKRRNVWIDRFLNNFTYKNIFIAEASKKSFIDHGYKENERQVVLYNGCEDAGFVERDFTVKNKKIITVASLYEHKGHTYLFRAFKGVLEAHEDIQLLLVGDGLLEDSLKSEAEELGLGENIVFLGAQDDVNQYLAQAHIFVLPSLREGIPLSVIEAMASGLPVIASDVGGLKEMIQEDENGLLCPPKNSDLLKNAILSLLEDTQKCSQFAQASRQTYLDKFTSKRMIDGLDQIYQQGIK